MKLKVKKAFKWAHRHVDIQEYGVGDVIETEDQDLIRVATEEGWVSKGKESKPEAPASDASVDLDAPAEQLAADAEPVHSTE